MLVEKIDQYLIGKEKTLNLSLLEDMRTAFDFSVTRQLMEYKEGSSSLRGSNPGPCARAMAYAFHGFPETKNIEPRSMLTFLTGDLIELIAVGLARLSGISIEKTCLDKEGQAEGFFDVGNGLLIPCHADGIIPAQPGVCDEDYLYEVKSTSDFGFKREWLKGIVGTKYMLQHQVYLDTFGLDKGVFFVINKNTGHYCEVLTERNPSIVEQARQNYTAAGFSDPDNLPDRFQDGKDYGLRMDKGGEMTEKLCWGCSYCSFVHSCWPTAEVTFEKGKPVYTVKNEPTDKSDIFLDI